MCIRDSIWSIASTLLPGDNLKIRVFSHSDRVDAYSEPFTLVAVPTRNTAKRADNSAPVLIAVLVALIVVLCGGVALYIARRIKRARRYAAAPLGDFELNAVDAVPIAAVTIVDEEDSAGVWAAPATADPGSLPGVKTEMANGVPGVAL